MLGLQQGFWLKKDSHCGDISIEAAQRLTSFQMRWNPQPIVLDGRFFQSQELTGRLCHLSAGLNPSKANDQLLIDRNAQARAMSPLKKIRRCKLSSLRLLSLTFSSYPGLLLTICKQCTWLRKDRKGCISCLKVRQVRTGYMSEGPFIWGPNGESFYPLF